MIRILDSHFNVLFSCSGFLFVNSNLGCRLEITLWLLYTAILSYLYGNVE
jgi:hypothetical protein